MSSGCADNSQKFSLQALESDARDLASSDLTFSLTSPDGNPVILAKAVLVPSNHRVDVRDGDSFSDEPYCIHAKTQTGSKIIFAEAPSTFLLVVISPDGVLVKNSAEIGSDRNLSLVSWGKIWGHRRLGHKIGANRKLTAWTTRFGENNNLADDPHRPNVTFTSEVVTDAEGAYQVEQVVPGDVYIDATDPLSWGTIGRPLFVVNVKARQKAFFDFGGQGRKIEGHVQFPDASGRWTCAFCVVQTPIGVPAPIPQKIEAESIFQSVERWANFNQSPAGLKWRLDQDRQIVKVHATTFPFDVQKNGTFTVEDVEPGTYKIYFNLRDGSKRSTKEFNFEINDEKEGENDKPLVLPAIKLEYSANIKSGDEAPDFNVAGLDGKSISLSEHRGKYVVLDFWATWCEPCVAEVPNLKTLYEKFGNRDDFVMIGLSADESPDKPFIFVRDHNLQWKQGYLDGEREDAEIEKAYGVTGIPSIWLIDKDGKVIKKNLRGQDLLSAVNEKLAF